MSLDVGRTWLIPSRGLEVPDASTSPEPRLSPGVRIGRGSSAPPVWQSTDQPLQPRSCRERRRLPIALPRRHPGCRKRTLVCVWRPDRVTRAEPIETRAGTIVGGSPAGKQQLQTFARRTRSCKGLVGGVVARGQPAPEFFHQVLEMNSGEPGNGPGPVTVPNCLSRSPFLAHNRHTNPVLSLRRSY